MVALNPSAARTTALATSLPPALRFKEVVSTPWAGSEKLTTTSAVIATSLLVSVGVTPITIGGVVSGGGRVVKLLVKTGLRALPAKSVTPPDTETAWTVR